MIEVIDREEELRRLKGLFTATPNAIYFYFGPKSCGKTTVIQEAIYQSVQEGQPASFYYYDLRERFIRDYKAVLDVLFERRQKKVMRRGSWTLDLKFFKITKERFEEILEGDEDPFEVMKEGLWEVRDKEGGVPNIIIDELQKLRWIYINGERQFVDELLNFFVTITKASHLANVFILTSDTFFIEELYGNSKLADASEYMKMGWLPEAAVEEHLRRHGFSSEEIRLVLERIGGRAWAVEQVRIKKGQGIPVSQAVEEDYRNIKGILMKALYEARQKGYSPKELKDVLSEFREKESFSLNEEDPRLLHIKYLVEREVLFFDPIDGTVQPHSKTMLLAIREVLG